LLAAPESLSNCSPSVTRGFCWPRAARESSYSAPPVNTAPSTPRHSCPPRSAPPSWTPSSATSLRLPGRNQRRSPEHARFHALKALSVAAAANLSLNQKLCLRSGANLNRAVDKARGGLDEFRQGRLAAVPQSQPKVASTQASLTPTFSSSPRKLQAHTMPAGRDHPPIRFQGCTRRPRKLGRRRPVARRCCSSVVEHSLGKGEVESSIPSSSTSFSMTYGSFLTLESRSFPPRLRCFPPIWRGFPPELSGLPSHPPRHFTDRVPDKVWVLMGVWLLWPSIQAMCPIGLPAWAAQVPTVCLST
jgi:hypothetical protein